MQCVFYARFLLFHFHFGCSADFDQGHTAGQFGDALLQFFLVIVTGGVFNLLAHILDALFDTLGITRTVDDRGVFLAGLNALGCAQLLQRNFLQR